jgi:YHS domain-containing protein
MKRFLRSLDPACVAVVVILVGSNAVGAPDNLAQNTAANGPILLAMEVPRKDAMGGTKAKLNVDREGVILKGYDVVAYFKEGNSVKGNPEIKSSYQDATYLFASAEDKADFDKDPAKYAPQYGGFCAYGVSLGVLADIENPDAFAVYNSKLYVCGDQASLKKFKADMDKNIEKADRQWRRISNLSSYSMPDRRSDAGGNSTPG